MPKSAVIDASILVSAFLFPESVPGRVVALADQGRYALHFSPILLAEVRRSLHHPHLKKANGHMDAAIDAWCAALHDIGFLLTAALPKIGPVCSDPDDDHVIAAALAAGANCVVTGDRDLLALGQHAGIRIVTARQFIEDFEDKR
jgi:uncharacterized protein